jgi:nucleoid-associated protein YgaU
MTSDAKIGLLLGLVFIFAIAFIINGLPGLHHKDDSNKLTTNMVGLQSNPSGLGANERKVALEPAVVAPPASPAQPAENTAGSTEARYTMELPQGTPTNADTAPVAAPMADSGVVATVKPAPTISVAPAVTATAPVINSPPTPKPESAKPTAPKTYVVQEGDTLSSIAKKVFGEQQGNKLANINALFEANRKTLASADNLQVGQKLIVPTLPSSTSGEQGRTTASAPTPANALPGSNFAKVDSVGQRHSTANTDKPAPTAKAASSAKPGSVYVVKDGDSLWQIASERLGDGNRYKEIVKLNSDVLKNEDTLEVGMQLKLPAK